MTAESDLTVNFCDYHLFEREQLKRIIRFGSRLNGSVESTSAE